MQPTPAWREEHSFETESKRSFGPKLLSVGENPYTQSSTSIKNRRNFDIYSVKSLLQAPYVLDQRLTNVDKLSELAESSKKTYNEEEYILTPCRFSPSGWKYVRKDVK